MGVTPSPHGWVSPHHPKDGCHPVTPWMGVTPRMGVTQSPHGRVTVNYLLRFAPALILFFLESKSVQTPPWLCFSWSQSLCRPRPDCVFPWVKVYTDSMPRAVQTPSQSLCRLYIKVCADSRLVKVSADYVKGCADLQTLDSSKSVQTTSKFMLALGQSMCRLRQSLCRLYIKVCADYVKVCADYVKVYAGSTSKSEQITSKSMQTLRQSLCRLRQSLCRLYKSPPLKL